MIRSSSLLILVCCTPVVAQAQCQIVSINVTNQCGPNAPFVTVDLAGGVPPYQLTFTGSNGVVLDAQSFAQGTFSTYLPTAPLMDSPVEVVVTDELGCVATTSAYFNHYVAYWAEVWFEQACPPTMGTLFWRGTFDIIGSPGNPDPCGGGLEYAIDRDGLHLSGVFPNGWSQLANGFWRFDTPLATGYDYSVILYTPNTSSGCWGGSNVVYCPTSSGGTASSSTCGQQFHLKAALGGALPSGTLMRDDLRAADLLPLTEPYTALGYVYTGSPTALSTTQTVLNTTGVNAIVDWVVVELRSATAPGTILYSAPFLLQSDGDVVDMNGSHFLTAPLPPELYHVAILHRNHLGVMTASPTWLNKNLYSTLTVDLRNGSLPMYGTIPRMQVGNTWCLWPGDVTGDGSVRYTGAGNDRDLVLQGIGGLVPTNTVTGQYRTDDVNLDGVVKYAGEDNDRDIILHTIGGTVPTAVRYEQVPGP
ncbi:MAG TPA: hypothetical protein PKN30_15400 [Flavobacteriales bacterium]|nr:hypothetical protein [Flavobacteriales bacterium]